MARTMVCVAVMVDGVDDALAAARTARDGGADLVEFRIDGIFDGEGDLDGQRACLRLAADTPLPCIVTCRSADEGGDYRGDESARVSLYEALGTAERAPAFLDLELASYERSANLRQKVHLAVSHAHQARAVETRLVLSMHDFDARPGDLWQRLDRMRESDAARVRKVAYRARSIRDNLELFELMRTSDRPTIAIGMGEFGVMSRVLAGKFGAFLTFASLDDGSGTAPGQVSLHELLRSYRFREIGPETRVFGVMGYPVAHSISPAVHNAAFGEAGFDGVYVPMPVAPGWESFKATALSLVEDGSLHFGGASVTIPHKEHLVRLANEQGWAIDAVSARTGAANTLVVRGPGSCEVWNTDVAAAVGLLDAALDGVARRRVGVIGAGGVGRAIATGLVDAGAEVAVFNRNVERASDVCAKINDGRESTGTPPGQALPRSLEDIETSACEAVVNATPIGMLGTDWATESPITPASLRGMTPCRVVFDTVYVPRQTPLIRAAEAAGKSVIFGVEMFAGQAAAQGELWAGETCRRVDYAAKSREVLENGRR